MHTQHVRAANVLDKNSSQAAQGRASSTVPTGIRARFAISVLYVSGWKCLSEALTDCGLRRFT
jgi:hypothetical protein